MKNKIYPEQSRRKIFTKIFILSVFSLGFFGFSGQAQAGNTYYVDNTAQNCTDGAITYNPATKTCGNGMYKMYTTIQKAVDIMKPGDTALVREGAYAEYVLIGLGHGVSGESNNPITLKAADGERVEINYADIPMEQKANDHMFYIHSRDYWIIDGFIFNSNRAFNAYPNSGQKFLVNFWNAKNNIIKNCKFLGNDIDHRGNGGAISLQWGITNITIENNFLGGFYCSFDDCDIHGVGISDTYGNSGILIRNNTFKGLSGDGVHATAFGPHHDITIENNVFKGIYPGYEENAVDIKIARNLIIRNNVMSGYNKHKPSGGGSPITLNNNEDHDNVLIEGNILFDSIEGIVVAAKNSANNVTIRRNLIFNIMKDNGLYGSGLRLNKMTNSKIYHNTLAYVAGDAIYLENVGNNFLNLEIKNNIVYQADNIIRDPSALAGDKNKVFIGINNFFNQNGEKFLVGANTYNLQGLQSNLSQAIGSINSDPKFINPSIDDNIANFNLQATSPAIDIGGVISGVNDNFLGDGPDLGVYEYQGGGTVDTIPPAPPSGVSVH